MVVLAVTCVVPAFVGVLRRTGHDRPARLLAFATAVLPAGRKEWGQAMSSELDRIDDPAERWRFSLGCAWAAVVIRGRTREAGGAGLRSVVFAGIATALVLAAYGIVHYPGLRTDGARFWGSLAFFVVVLAAYAATALLLSRGQTRNAVRARRYGLLGGLTIGVAWLAALSPTPALKEFVLAPLVVALLVPLLVGRSAGALASVWTAVVGGLLAFAVWVSLTYLRDGRPYDAGLVRDFHRSGAATFRRSPSATTWGAG